jgi:hypothetical protein
VDLGEFFGRAVLGEGAERALVARARLLKGIIAARRQGLQRGSESHDDPGAHQRGIAGANVQGVTIQL